MYVIKSIFDKYNIEYSAYGKTMLGCVVNNGLTPWNDTIKLMMLQDQCCKMTENCLLELLNAGFNVIMTQGLYTIVDILETGFSVKIYIMKYIDASKIVCVSGNSNRKNIFINFNELYPLRDYQFGMTTIKGMNNPENYFIRCKYDNYNKIATITHIKNNKKQLLLSQFLNTFKIKSLQIKDTNLLHRKSMLQMTDDWNTYFYRGKKLIPSDFSIDKYKMEHNMPNATRLSVHLQYMNQLISNKNKK